MRLIFFNILDGAQDDRDRLARILDWLRRQNADIVALAECNGWQEGDAFVTNSRAAGYEYGQILSESPSPYKPAVLSHQPIERVAAVTEGFHHGLLHVRTGGLDVLCTHFSPNNRQTRAREGQLAGDRLAGCGGPAVLMGDLNSLSPVDMELIERFVPEGDRDWAMDTRPHEMIRRRGAIDLGQTVPADQRWTTATALRPDEPKRRLDFVYANDAMRRQHPQMVARPVRDEVTASLSDHFPVVTGPACGS